MLKNALLIAIVAVIIISCKNSSSKTETTAPEAKADISAPISKVDTLAALKAQYKYLRATFKEFSLGDVEHYSFEGADGTAYSFEGNYDSDYNLAITLPEHLMNESNQGWGSNESYVNKTFDIFYSQEHNEEYGFTMDIIQKLILVDQASQNRDQYFSPDEVEEQIKFIREKFGTITTNRDNGNYSTIKFTVDDGGEFINYERSNKDDEVKFFSISYCSDHGCETTSYYFWDDQLIFRFIESSSWVGNTDEVYEKRTYYLDEIEIRCLEREHSGTGGYDKVKAQLAKIKQQTLDCSDTFDRSTISGLLNLTEDKAEEFFFGAPSSSADIEEDNFLELGFELISTERIGGLGLSASESTITELVGKSDNTSTPRLWGADGEYHVHHYYDSKGLDINIIINEDESFKSIHSIAALPPCTLSTSKGIRIGSTYEDVKTAYSAYINQETMDEEIIIAGTVYGGVYFTFKNNLVSSIFIGATAE